MAMKICMNIDCGTTSCAEWKTGWRLRSGELANLCDKCGYAFEQGIFCEEFHKDASGWRKCVTCGKRLHCGCIASLPLITLVFPSGVKCSGCARNSVPKPGLNGDKCDKNGLCTVSENSVGIVNHKDTNGGNQPPMPCNLNANAILGLLKQEGLLPTADTGAHPNLNVTLDVMSGNLQFTPGTVTDEKEQSKTSIALNQGFASPSLTPRPPKLPSSPAPNTNLSMMMPQLCLARRPVEGRGRHQLLSRYHPRITNQELQQMSGNSNSTIVPLFEKVLSASDAGPTGRLVLPKACAEAYFPAISEPEGFPIKIQDVKGKEWGFQFRFWPNNNSRMYVLEGVTSCIQSMQLQASDTVIFCRKEPEGKLVMGYRKSSDSSLQPMKRSTDTDMNALSRQLDPAGGNVNLHNIEKCGEPTEESLLPLSMMKKPSKKSRSIGSKSKGLRAQALRLTREEGQVMLRPPPSAKPSIVVIDDYEFEEYKEPPVFGKSSVFAARSSGEIEQWAQCDSCSKWRRLPADFLLPPGWVCADNSWDPARWFCSAVDELSPGDLENLINLSKGSGKKRKRMANREMLEEDSYNPNEAGTSSVATTSKLQSLDDEEKEAVVQPGSIDGPKKPS